VFMVICSHHKLKPLKTFRMLLRQVVTL